MATLGVCSIYQILPSGEDQFAIEVSVAACQGSQIQGQPITVGFAPNALVTTINAAVKDAAQAYLESRGIVFGGGDTVRFINGIV